MAFTKLNMVDARLVFPCFDQIDLKAEYKLFLGHVKGITALTNAKFLSQREM